MTAGLEVLVQLVMAAMTTSPSVSVYSAPFTSTCGLVATPPSSVMPGPSWETRPPESLGSTER
jgi:hypothetical protein